MISEPAFRTHKSHWFHAFDSDENGTRSCGAGVVHSDAPGISMSLTKGPGHYMYGVGRGQYLSDGMSY